MRLGLPRRSLAEHRRPSLPRAPGGRSWATIATLLTTARLNDVDPFAWLKITLERIAAGWPNRELNALLPWNFQKS